MQYNKNPISLREGHAFIDGVEVLDSVKMTVNFTPETWTGRQLGEKTPSTRWIGAAITGNMTRRRTTNWLKTKIKEYLASGATPELVIQGIMDDTNSDFYAAHGSDVLTCVGCVMTPSHSTSRILSDVTGIHVGHTSTEPFQGGGAPFLFWRKSYEQEPEIFHARSI